jgi:hypothetical protein
VEVKTQTKEERIEKHVRSIKLSLVPAVMGTLAGFLSSSYVLSTPHQPIAFVILALAIYAQKYIQPLWGIDSSKFGGKDWFYLVFMTFAFWYVSWTIIVNGMPGGVPQFGPFF